MTEIESFELDETHGLVWIVFQHERFRLNCSDKFTMLFWAKFWLARELPTATNLEKRDFLSRFGAFIDVNEEKIQILAEEIKAKRRDELVKLIADAKTEMRCSVKWRE